MFEAIGSALGGLGFSSKGFSEWAELPPETTSDDVLMAALNHNDTY